MRQWQRAVSVLALMIAGLSTSAYGRTLEKVLSIGSDEPNYTFFVISGALMTDTGEFIVADSKGSCLRKYDQHGKFIKEVGRLGQGPEEFGDLIGGMYLAENIYVLDPKNRRITELDHDLNFRGYFRIPSNCSRLLKIGQLFYSSRFDPVAHVCEIIGFDEEAAIRSTFLRKGPEYLRKVNPGKMAYPVKLMFSSVNMHRSRETNEIVAVFADPGRTIQLEYFTPDGQPIKSHSIEHPIDYDFPSHLLEFPRKHPDRSTKVAISAAFYLNKETIALQYSIVDFEKETPAKTSSYILFIDSNEGRIADRIEIDPNLKMLDVHRDMFCFKHDGDDGETIQVYKISE